MRLALDVIRLDFQGPECLDEEAVQAKVFEISETNGVAPVTVRFDGGSYFLQDGFHRIEAARRLGHQDIAVEVFSGTLAEMESEWAEMLSAALTALRADTFYQSTRPARGIAKR